jgi:hypothetical protein
MNNQELLQQFLAVASRASQQGKSVEQVVGIMEIAKTVVIGQSVRVEQKPSIVPASALPPGTLGRG